MEYYSAITGKELSMKQHGWISDALYWEKGARNQRLYSVWFLFYQVIEKAKLIYSDREHSGSFLGPGWGISAGFHPGSCLILGWQSLFWNHLTQADELCEFCPENVQAYCDEPCFSLPLCDPEPSSLKCSRTFSHLPELSLSSRSHFPHCSLRVSHHLADTGLIVFFSTSKTNFFWREFLTFWVILGLFPFHISWEALGLNMPHIQGVNCFAQYASMLLFIFSPIPLKKWLCDAPSDKSEPRLWFHGLQY